MQWCPDSIYQHTSSRHSAASVLHTVQCPKSIAKILTGLVWSLWSQTAASLLPPQYNYLHRGHKKLFMRFHKDITHTFEKNVFNFYRLKETWTCKNYTVCWKWQHNFPPKLGLEFSSQTPSSGFFAGTKIQEKIEEYSQIKLFAS